MVDYNGPRTINCPVRFSQRFGSFCSEKAPERSTNFLFNFNCAMKFWYIFEIHLVDMNKHSARTKNTKRLRYTSQENRRFFSNCKTAKKYQLSTVSCFFVYSLCVFENMTIQSKELQNKKLATKHQ